VSFPPPSWDLTEALIWGTKCEYSSELVPFPYSRFSISRRSSLASRLASDGESLREGHNVEYFTQTKSLLNRCVSKRQMPFTWTINSYRGCEFGCKYSCAHYTHEFMEMRDGIEFERKICVKQHAAELLRQELRRVKPGAAIKPRCRGRWIEAAAIPLLTEKTGTIVSLVQGRSPSRFLEQR
jgi:hypothetical protein